MKAPMSGPVSTLRLNLPRALFLLNFLHPGAAR